MKKKRLIPFDNKWLWAAISTVVIIPTLTLCWKHAGRVWASPNEIDQVKSEQKELRQQNVRQGEWIDQSIKETDMKKKAPKGFRYEESVGEYVEWKEDPRLKKK